MKKIKYTFFMILLSISYFSFASEIGIETVEIVAKNLYSEKSGIEQNEIMFEDIFSKTLNGEIYYYVFDVVGEKGFVIVSAEDAFYPIIGYSTKGKYITENQPENITSWMQNYVNQINYLRNNYKEANDEISAQWKKYNVPFDEFVPAVSGKVITPMTDEILWNQDNGWNDLCPEDASGSGGHVYAG